MGTRLQEDRSLRPDHPRAGRGRPQHVDGQRLRRTPGWRLPPPS